MHSISDKNEVSKNPTVLMSSGVCDSSTEGLR